MSHAPNSSNNNEARTTLAVPDPEVVIRPNRGRFTADYKQRILQAVDDCPHGERGALLRREGLYSSHITTWRQQRADGKAQGLMPQTRGRKSDPQAAEIARLKREIGNLQSQLQRAEMITRTWRWCRCRCPKKTFAASWADTNREQRHTMIQMAEQLAPEVGLTTACAVLSVPRSSLYRARQPQATPAVRVTLPPVRKLSDVERQVVHTTLNSERFQDCAPRHVYATLLDEAVTYVRSPLCIVFWLKTRRFASDAINCAIRITSSRNY